MIKLPYAKVFYWYFSLYLQYCYTNLIGRFVISDIFIIIP